MVQKGVTFEFEGKKVRGVLHVPESVGRFPCIINVHGFAGGMYEPLQQELAKRAASVGFCCFLFDFYDKPFGKTEISHDEASLTLQLAILKRAVEVVSSMKKVDASCIFLVGHSLGASCALLFANRHRVQGVVAIAPVWNFGKTLDSSPAALQYYAGKEFIEFGEDFHHVRVRRRFIEDALGYDVADEVLTLNCSILIVHGKADTIVPITQSEEIMRHLGTRAGFCAISEGGHNFYQKEALDMVMESIMSFLKRISRSGAGDSR